MSVVVGQSTVALQLACACPGAAQVCVAQLLWLKYIGRSWKVQNEVLTRRFMLYA